MTKRLIKPIIVAILAFVARAVMGRYRPKVVMVTGSVGKTSTKDAVAAALSERFSVRKSEKSFNSEFGVPFTILGVGNPWANPVAWLIVVRKALALLLLPNHYPNLLVLEVGADKPGDLKRILRIARPDAVVVTRLPAVPVHVEFYASPEAVREEEFAPAYALSPGAPLIVCSDDPYALEMASRVRAPLSTYGFDAASSVRLSDIAWHKEDGVVVGMRAKITVGIQTAPLVIRGSVGKTQLLPAAAAIATAAVFNISLADAITALGGYEPPAGRGRLFRGVHNSVIIDDSYNSSPVALEEALDTLASFPIEGRPASAPSSHKATNGHSKATAGKRIAVLGDMLELGRYSVMEHERVGERVAHSVDLLVSVGIRARGLAASARAKGLSDERILSFDDAASAAVALPSLLQQGDVLLVKGSQSIRTERIVEALLASPADRTRLVRQDRQWQKR
ncbi:MAG: Mur ligase family protein [bacterium]|nr:Mur ligase family protein [bacterium]